MRPHFQLALMLIVPLLGCSDDTKQPAIDTGTSKDGPTLMQDKGTPAADHSTIEASSGTQTCSQVGECAKSCGINMTCLETCKSKGCTSAKTTFDALTQCSIKNCMSDCVQGFNDTCNACASLKCTNEYNACLGHTC